MSKYFGTDGYRGEAGVSLTAESAFRTGAALGKYIERHGLAPRVLIGKDTRLSSDMLEHAVASGLASVGISAALSGIIPTAGVSYLTSKHGYGLGVMISASHNPYYDNGIKLISASGEKLSDRDEIEIEQLIDTGAAHSTKSRIERIYEHRSAADEYTEHLISSGTSLKGLKIALDTASGAAYEAAQRVLCELGAKLVRHDPEPNGINIHDRVGSTHPNGLSALTKTEKCNLGIALDGDSDRCIAADECGSIIDGDGILYLLATDMKRRGELNGGTVVATVMSNLGLSTALKRLGIRVEQTPVGDRYVYAKMRESGYSLGGEQSGHIIIGKEARTGDGILTAIRIAQVLQASAKPISSLLSPLHLLPQRTISVAVKDKGVIDSPRVKKAKDSARATLGDKGRVILRASGTEEVVRITVEAQSEGMCREIAEMLKYAILAEDEASSKNDNGAKIE